MQIGAELADQQWRDSGLLYEQQPAIGADVTAIESGRDLLAMKVSEAV